MATTGSLVLLLTKIIRAEMVADPGHYRWFGYQVNGKVSDLRTPHQEYLAMGNDTFDRQENYRQLFTHDVDGELLKKLMSNPNKGMAVGNDRFKEELEILTVRRLKYKKGDAR